MARRSRPPAARTAALAGLVCAAIALAPAPGWAADGLTGSSPADGAALPAAPAAVVLTFSAPPDPAQSHVSIQDGPAVPAGAGEATRSGPTGLRVAVSIPAAGNYTVAYHVIFTDGTDLTGVLRFSVGTGQPPPPLNADQARQARQAVAATHDHTVDPLSGTLLVLDVAVLVGVVLLLLRRPVPRRAPDTHGTEAPDDPDR